MTYNLPTKSTPLNVVQQAAIFKTNTTQNDHSPDNVKYFPDISLMVHSIPPWHWHVKRYSYHACTSVTVSGAGRNATVHDPKPYI